MDNLNKETSQLSFNCDGFLEAPDSEGTVGPELENQRRKKLNSPIALDFITKMFQIN